MKVNKLKETIAFNITSASNASNIFVYTAIQCLILEKPAIKTNSSLILMSKRLKKTYSNKGLRSVLGAAGLLKRIKGATS